MDRYRPAHRPEPYGYRPRTKQRQEPHPRPSRPRSRSDRYKEYDTYTPACRSPSRPRLFPQSSPTYPEPTPGYTDYEFASQRLRHRNKSIDVSLPKHFVAPITCFFWHHFGRCNKRDEDCAYAHWDTGYLAAAPINIVSATGSGGCLPSRSMPGDPPYNHAQDLWIADKSSTESVAGTKARDPTVHTSGPSSTNLTEGTEVLHVRQERLRLKEKSFEKRVEDLEKSVRLREQEVQKREKRVASMEAVQNAKAGCSSWVCEKCGQQGEWP
ncbi:hypothetical protein BU26DRAFT_605758 [Trematosphaeria pertusa]|uniref:C3H1-type domain-containing protein n=1 Tax=Trematosphaeria pertusa TaxID=390896 RepID=A0A6A6IDG6_9PLEO|nr:uncharacterized protein BU26DRAFT_605758 [Trematosphaeria pertusa]KAF2248259.1 hypothetical protein BU26DRAFT_605758 [Trematosphaeria pertusa]